MTIRTVAECVLACLLTSDAVAQSPVEVWGAFSGAVAPPAGAVVSSYEPTLLFGTTLTGSAGQTLTLDAQAGPGLQAGINVFPARHFGLQVLVDRARMTLGGTNGPYGASLQYVSRQPPDNVPQVFTSAYSTVWPGTTGSMSQLTMAFNGVARTNQAGPVSASLSAGVAWARFTGTVEPLGYTEYHLGGHSTLFYEEMRLACDLGPTNRVGFNVGGDLSVALGHRIAVVGGYRFIDVGTVDLPVAPTRITNADQVTFGETIENIRARMQLAPAHIGGRSSRIIIGLKVTP